jgi:hypothetical protein
MLMYLGILPIVPKILLLLLLVLRKDSIIVYHFVLCVMDCCQLEDSYEEQFDDLLYRSGSFAETNNGFVTKD